MKILPNGVTVFNATPHPIRFWDEAWPEPIKVEPDKMISAQIEEEIVEKRDIILPINNLNPHDLARMPQITLVRTRFVGDAEGEEIARRALAGGADVVVGSIIAAQAYPGLVVAMCPAPGYERVAPAEKRMRPDKFTVFPVQ